MKCCHCRIVPVIARSCARLADLLRGMFADPGGTGKKLVAALVHPGTRLKRRAAFFLLLAMLFSVYLILAFDIFVDRGGAGLFRASRRALNSGDFALARILLVELIERDKNSETAIIMLAECFEANHQLEEALRCWNRVCLLNPANALYHSRKTALEQRIVKIRR